MSIDLRHEREHDPAAQRPQDSGHADPERIDGQDNTEIRHADRVHRHEVYAKHQGGTIACTDDGNGCYEAPEAG